MFIITESINNDYSDYPVLVEVNATVSLYEKISNRSCLMH